MALPTFNAVVPAAGIGSRMGSSLPKQYLPLLDATVIEYALAPLLNHPAIQTVVVVLSAQDQRFLTLPVSSHPKITTVVGGKERADSVLAGLNALASENTNSYVMVHDAARPCLTIDDIDLLIEGVEGHADGAILAQPVVETVKLSGASHHIEGTLDRSRVYLAQTPQCFPLIPLQKGYQQAQNEGWPATDEASIFEMLGYSPRLVSGRRRNIKITHPDDLALASFYLQDTKAQCE